MYEIEIGNVLGTTQEKELTPAQLEELKTNYDETVKNLSTLGEVKILKEMKSTLYGPLRDDSSAGTYGWFAKISLDSDVILSVTDLD